MKKIIIPILVLLLAACSPAPVPMMLATATLGNVYYVSPTGNDANAGTSSAPWKTIQKAANTMNAGDTVNVLAGDYTANGVVQISKSGSDGKPIIYQAQGKVMMGGFYFGWDGFYNYTQIRGFDITSNYATTNDDDDGIFLSGAFNVVENNNIYKVGGGIMVYGYYPAATSRTHDNIIRNNKIYDSFGIGIITFGRNTLVEGNEIWGLIECAPPDGTRCGIGADGMRFYGQGHVFRNNNIKIGMYGPKGINPDVGDFIDDAHLDCFQTWDTANFAEAGSNILFEGNYCDNLQYPYPDETLSGQGWMIEGTANNITFRNNVVRAHRAINTRGATNAALVNHLYIYNNTFINNLSVGVYEWSGINLYAAPYTIAKNNIFYDQKHTSFEIGGDTTGQVIDYNLVYNSDGSLPRNLSMFYPQLHELRGVNPMFVNAAAKDYHLQAGSPACTGGENGTYMGAFPCDVSITATPTWTATPTHTATLLPTFTRTPTASFTPTLPSTATSAPTYTQTLTPTHTPTKTPTRTPTRTRTPTPTKTSTPTAAPVCFRYAAPNVQVIPCP